MWTVSFIHFVASLSLSKNFQNHSNVGFEHVNFFFILSFFLPFCLSCWMDIGFCKVSREIDLNDEIHHTKFRISSKRLIRFYLLGCSQFCLCTQSFSRVVNDVRAFSFFLSLSNSIQNIEKSNNWRFVKRHKFFLKTNFEQQKS